MKKCDYSAICPVHEEEVRRIYFEVKAEETGHYLRPILSGDHDSSKVSH